MKTKRNGSMILLVRITHISLTLSLVLCLLTGAKSMAIAQSSEITLPKGVERVTSVEGITEYRLPNGLRALLFPDSSRPTITVNVTYLVGSKHENYGETGMAHLIEHLAFKGSKEHPEYVKEAEARGARWNGSTWLDRTNYFETLPATEENLNWALHLEADRMVNSFIAKKDLDSEMTVVRNEFESRENSPARVLSERLYSTAYLWHNYGKATIGARSDIENVPIERIQAFYRKYYQPDNAVLLVAGKFDEAKTLGLIHQYFAPIPKPTRQLPKLYTDEPDQDGERMVTLRRTGDVQLVAAGYHIPPGSHPEAAAIEVLAQLLTDSPSGRLHKALVETKKASAIFNETYLFSEPGLLIAGAEVRQEVSLDAARENLVQTIEGVAVQPPTKEEVERIRGKLLKELELRLSSSGEVGIELSEWLGMGDWRLLFLHRDRLRQVSPEGVQRAAANYLKASNRTLALFIPTTKPDRARIPSAPDVVAAVKDYKGDPPIAPGEAFDPSPTNINSRTTFSVTSGGLKLALLPKKTRGNAVVANLTLRFGDEKSLIDRAMTARMVGWMLIRGTARHTRQQLQDEFDRLKAKVEVTADVNSTTALVETTRDHLPALMSLLAEVFRSPSFPADEFEQLRQERLAAHEKQRSDPEEMALSSIRNILNPYPKGDPRYASMPAEAIAELKSVTLEDVKKFHADFFSAQHGVLAVAGDFDDKAIVKLSEELFNGWKSRAPYARLVRTFKDIAPSAQTIDTPDKENAVFVVGMNLRMRVDDPDRPALDLVNWMLSNTRLWDRIRQREGLSYSVWSWIAWDLWDSVSPFRGVAICAPQNQAKVESAFKGEIARALKDGFTAEEVAAAKAGLLQYIRVSLSDDRSLVRLLSALGYSNRSPFWTAEQEKYAQALTPEQVNAALRKHFDMDKLNIIRAGDFSKAKALQPANK